MKYKVVTHDLKSLGLRKNPNILSFYANQWIFDPAPTKNSKDSGGIWVANSLGAAHTLKKYMLSRYNTECRIFVVDIGRVLYQNSYRTKTDKVMLLDEVF